MWWDGVSGRNPGTPKPPCRSASPGSHSASEAETPTPRHPYDVYRMKLLEDHRDGLPGEEHVEVFPPLCTQSRFSDPASTLCTSGESDALKKSLFEYIGTPEETSSDCSVVPAEHIMAVSEVLGKIFGTVSPRVLKEITKSNSRRIHPLMEKAGLAQMPVKGTFGNWVYVHPSLYRSATRVVLSTSFIPFRTWKMRHEHEDLVMRIKNALRAVHPHAFETRIKPSPSPGETTSSSASRVYEENLNRIKRKRPRKTAHRISRCSSDSRPAKRSTCDANQAYCSSLVSIPEDSKETTSLSEGNPHAVNIQQLEKRLSMYCEPCRGKEKAPLYRLKDHVDPKFIFSDYADPRDPTHENTLKEHQIARIGGVTFGFYATGLFKVYGTKTTQEANSIFDLMLRAERANMAERGALSESSQIGRTETKFNMRMRPLRVDSFIDIMALGRTFAPHSTRLYQMKQQRVFLVIPVSEQRVFPPRASHDSFDPDTEPRAKSVVFSTGSFNNMGKIEDKCSRSYHERVAELIDPFRVPYACVEPITGSLKKVPSATDVQQFHGLRPSVNKHLSVIESRLMNQAARIRAELAQA